MGEFTTDLDRLYSYSRGLNREHRLKDITADALCSTCTHGTTFRRREAMTGRVFCRAIRDYVPGDIVECTAFERHNTMSLGDMNDIALSVDTRLGIDEKSYR